MQTIFHNLKLNERRKMEVILWKEESRKDRKKTRMFEEEEELRVKNGLSIGWSAGVVKKKKVLYSYKVLL
jgi:hypothetical protein